MTVARVSSTGAGGFFVFLNPAKKGDLIAALEAAGVSEATPDDARVVRIEHGRPRYGEEITERYLVQETAQLQAVHFSKGCYLGQEIVERVRSRAQIHRVLRRIDRPRPAAGSKLKSADGQADAGEIAVRRSHPRSASALGLRATHCRSNRPSARDVRAAI
jgi:aminomethyltransferase